MKIPKIFYGKTKEVIKAVNKIIKKLKSGATLLEACNSEMLETTEYDTMILIERLMTKNDTDNFFHLYLLPEKIINNFAPTKEEAKHTSLFKETERFYNEFYKSNWLSLLLVNSCCHIWLGDLSQHKIYLKRIVEIWPILNDKNIKVSFGESSPSQNIWFGCRTLRLVLSMQGLSFKDLTKRLENNDLKKFLSSHNLL